MGKKAPAPPDYTAAAEATAAGSEQAQRDAIYANRVDQTNPYGNVGYESYLATDPATGKQVTRWRQNETYSPEIQAALDAQIALQRGRSELGAGMMGDVQQDFATRQNFDQYGKPIQLGATSQVGGAGGAVGGAGTRGHTASMGSVPGYRAENLDKNLNFNDPGLNSQTLEQNLDYSGAPKVGSPEWTRAQAEKSVYDRGASRLDPRMAQEAQALDVRLRSQGLSPGDESYDKQMQNFERSKTDAYDALSATAMREGANQAQSMFGMESAYRDQSTGEEDRAKQFTNMAKTGQFGMDAQKQAQAYEIELGKGQFANQAKLAQMQASLAHTLGMGQLQIGMTNANNAGMQAANQGVAINNAAQQQNFQQGFQQTGYNNQLAFQQNALANQLRSQGMSEDAIQRATRLNEVNALISGQQVQSPNYQGYNQQGTAQGPDYLGATDNQYQAQLGQFGANQALTNSLIGGASQLGGMFAMSDRRLKTNIRKIAKINGTNWYEFDYIWGEHAIGVMADEVPHAAFMHPSGYLMVDYSRI